MVWVTVVSGKASPGTTTTVALLASTWPRPVLVVDADPTGGDLLPGWLGPWWADGLLRGDRGVASLAAATHGLPAESIPACALAPHVQRVPAVTGARLLAGVESRAQARAIGDDGWQRVAGVLFDLSSTGPDVLVDAGRWDCDTAVPLLTNADVVLLAVRSYTRHLAAAYATWQALRRTVPDERLGLVCCASTPHGTRRVRASLDLPIRAMLPDDPATAAVFSDAASLPGRRNPRRRKLVRAAARAAQRLATDSPPRATAAS